MNSYYTIIGILKKISEVLSSMEDNTWRPVIDDFITQLSDRDIEDKKEVIRSILRIYGGMGSFNDLVFYCKDNNFVEYNDRLDKLRTELHGKCVEKLTNY